MGKEGGGAPQKRIRALLEMIGYPILRSAHQKPSHNPEQRDEAGFFRVQCAPVLFGPFCHAFGNAKACTAPQSRSKTWAQTQVAKGY